jgi:hypothetical protein
MQQQRRHAKRSRRELLLGRALEATRVGGGCAGYGLHVQFNGGCYQI